MICTAEASATRTVLTAMKCYGLVVADNGAARYFKCTADERRLVAHVDDLKRIPARAFEAVDTAPMRISPDSARARR